MPCHAAIAEKPLTFKPDITVEKALKELKKSKQDAAAVVDDKGVLIGLFSVQVLMQNLLPVSVAVQDGITMDLPVKAAPGLAKRLRKVYPMNIEAFMERKKINVVYPETPIWEGVNKMITHPGPLLVVDKEKGCFLGVINHLSVLTELQRLLETEG